MFWFDTLSNTDNATLCCRSQFYRCAKVPLNKAVLTNDYHLVGAAGNWNSIQPMICEFSHNYMCVYDEWNEKGRIDTMIGYSIKRIKVGFLLYIPCCIADYVDIKALPPSLSLSLNSCQLDKLDLWFTVVLNVLCVSAHKWISDGASWKNTIGGIAMSISSVWTPEFCNTHTDAHCALSTKDLHRINIRLRLNFYFGGFIRPTSERDSHPIFDIQTRLDFWKKFSIKIFK